MDENAPDLTNRFGSGKRPLCGTSTIEDSHAYHVLFVPALP